MSKFQIITLFVFIVAIVAGAAAFALYKGGGASAALPPITVWGTFPANVFNQYVSDTNNTLSRRMTVNYTQFKAADFDNQFIHALANGQGPDVILISADQLLPEKSHLLEIPFSSVSERNFLNSYVGEAKVYLDQNGAWALPFTIDPLVMYWNRTIFNAAGLALPPRYWDEFSGTSLAPGLVQKLAVKDGSGNISRAAVALGDFGNITNAREILGSLFLQSGNPVTASGDSGPASTIASSNAYPSVVPALQFFSQFSEPGNSSYTWNKAMPNDKTAFLSANLAVYFGLASELFDIRNKNPNLDYDVAPLPELRSGVKAVYGQMYGFSIVRNSANSGTAFQVVSTLVDPSHLAGLSATMYLPSVLNTVIAQGTTDPYISIFNDEALVGKTWLDDPSASDRIFGSMIQSIVSGQKTADEAGRDAGQLYDAALSQAGQ